MKEFLFAVLNRARRGSRVRPLLFVGKVIGFGLLVAVALFGGMGLSGVDNAQADASLVMLPSPTAGTCGSSQNLEIVVKDALGNQAPNGTMVTVSTTFGYIAS